MAISFNCPHCDKLLKTPDNKAGVQANCPGCGQRLTVPQPGADVPEVEAVNTPPDPVPAAPAAAVGSQDPIAESNAGAPEDYKPCPMCGESIRKGATRCRFCGESLDKPAAWQPTQVEAGQILSRSWELFGKNFGLLVGATLLMGVVLFGAFMVLGAPVMLFFDHPGQDPGPVEIVLLTFIYIAVFAVSAYLQGGHIRMSLKIAAGEPAQIADLFSGIQYFLRIFLGHIILMVMAGIGFMMCILPYFLVLMTFWPFAFVIVDQNVGVIEAFQRSRQITANNLATILLLGLTVIGINLVSALTCGIGGIVAVPFIALIFAVAYRAMAGQLRLS